MQYQTYIDEETGNCYEMAALPHKTNYSLDRGVWWQIEIIKTSDDLGYRCMLNGKLIEGKLGPLMNGCFSSEIDAIRAGKDRIKRFESKGL